MVKEEGIVAEAGGGGRGYLDMLVLGEDAAAMADYFLYPSPSSSSYLHSSAAISAAPAAVASPGCASYLQPPPPPPPCHNILSFGGRAGTYYGGDVSGFQYYGGGQAIPAAVPQKSSPTAECSSSISSMSSSPTATAVSAISSCEPKASKKKGSRSSDQRKADAPAVPANKRPRVRREKLGERIQALQQLVSPFGKSDTASVLHEAFGYIRFLHDQVQALSTPYMQRLPSSARGPAAAVEPRASSVDLRSRGLCLVPVACTEHVTGGVADVWSSSSGLASTAQEGQQQDEMLRGDHRPGQLA